MNVDQLCAFWEALHALDTLAHAVKHVRSRWDDQLPRAEAKANLEAREILLRAETALLKEAEVLLEETRS